MNPQIRAILITILLVAHGTFAMPAPVAVTRKDLRLPEVRQEIGAWHAVVNRVAPMERRDFEELVVTWTRRGHRLHMALKRPWRPFLRYTGTGQGWALFVNPDTYPYRLRVQGKPRKWKWQLLYRRLDPDHALLDDVISYRRIRGSYDTNSTRPHPAWKHFCRWLTLRVAEERPDIKRVRIDFVRTHVTLPHEEPDDREVTRLVQTMWVPK